MTDQPSVSLRLPRCQMAPPRPCQQPSLMSRSRALTRKIRPCPSPEATRYRRWAVVPSPVHRRRSANEDRRARPGLPPPSGALPPRPYLASGTGAIIGEDCRDAGRPAGRPTSPPAVGTACRASRRGPECNTGARPRVPFTRKGYQRWSSQRERPAGRSSWQSRSPPSSSRAVGVPLRCTRPSRPRLLRRRLRPRPGAPRQGLRPST